MVTVNINCTANIGKTKKARSNNMTEENTNDQAEQTITINDTVYSVSELSDESKELLSLHEQATQMSIQAKRQATIHDLSIENLVGRIEKSVEAVEAEAVEG